MVFQLCKTFHKRFKKGERDGQESNDGEAVP